MRKENKKALSFMLTLALVFTSLFSTGGTYATEVEKVAMQAQITIGDIDGHWGENDINKAVLKGFVKGYQDGTFRPDQAVTRAEFVTMVNKALNLRDDNTVNLIFTDVKASDWYYKDIQKASYAQYVDGVSDTNFMPGKVITREEAATMLSRFLPKVGYQDETLLATYQDAARISNWAKSAVAVTVNKGYMTGYKNGNLSPKSTLTRAEAAKIICSIIEKETIVTDDVSVKDAGEILQDKIYAGDITIEKSVGEGEATLDNLSALSKVIVLGGGVNTVTVKNSLIVQLIVTKEGSKVRILSDGNTSIHETLVFNGNIVVDREGKPVKPGEGGYENIIYISDTFSAKDALKIASEIVKKIENSGKITKDQVAEGVAVIAPTSTVTVDEGGSIIITISLLESDNSNSGSNNSTGGTPVVNLANAKANAHNALATAFAIYVEGNYTYTNWITLTGFKTAGDTAIDAATSVAIVSSAQTVAINGMAGVEKIVATTTINGLNATMTAIAAASCSCGLPLTSTGAFNHAVEFDADGIVGGATTTGYAIQTAAQLQHLSLHLGANAVLMNDLDFTGLVTGTPDASTPMGGLKAANDSGIAYNGHLIDDFKDGNFVPIGDYGGNNEYKGNFYGNDKTITGLIISGSAFDCVGLFGALYDGTIQDLTLSGGAVTGNDYVGSVVGRNQGGILSAVHNTGEVNGYYNVGGVVGNNYGMVLNSHNTGVISANEQVGGIAGCNNGTITNSRNNGDASSTNGWFVGGIAGMNDGTVSNSYNTGTVKAAWGSVGGIVGVNVIPGKVNNSFNMGQVIGEINIGGVVGYNGGTVSASYNTGATNGIECVGGVVGNSCATVSAIYNTGTVNGTTSVGGVVGRNHDGSVTESYWLEGVASIGIGSGTGVSQSFSNYGVLNDMYASMSAIEFSAGGLVGSIVTYYQMNGGTTTPTTLNELQGSYVTATTSFGISVSAIFGMEIIVTTSSALGTQGSVVTPNSGIYSFSDLPVGTWIVFRAVNAVNPARNRSYTIYVKSEI